MIYAGKLLVEPEGPGGRAAAEALLPKGRERRKKRAAGSQTRLL